MQSGNLDDDLRTLQFTAQNRVDTVYDVNATLGGPVMRNRLWFFSTFRRWAANNYLGNTFTASGAQALDDQRLTDATLRLTGQLSERNKLTVHYDRSIKWRGHRPNNWITANINEPISSVVQTTGLNYIGQVKWSSPISNRLLAEASVFTLPVNYKLSFQPDADPNAVATFDQIRSVFSGVSPRQDINTARMYTYAGFMSYVTGAHNLKAGIQVRTGWSQELFQSRGDIVQILNNGVANSVRLVNNESGHKESGVNTGIYLQDSWTFGRITLNPGVRYERFTMTIPEQSAAAGRWVPARQFAEQKNIVNWNTFSPRFGMSWDVMGDGKTAVKAGISRYDRLAGANLVQPLNQKNISFQTCPWADPNGNLFAETTEIAFDRCTGSLQPSLGFVEDGLKRPFQWEWNVVGAAPGGRPHLGDAGLLRPQVLGPLHDGERRRADDRLLAGHHHQPARRLAADRLQPGPGHARPGAQRAEDAARALAALPRRRGAVHDPDRQRQRVRRLHHRPELRRPGHRRPQQPEPAHQQPRQHRLRRAVPDSRRVQLHVPLRRAVRRLAALVVGPAADPHLRRHHHAGARPDAGDAERAGGQARRLPLRLDQPARPARVKSFTVSGVRIEPMADLFNVFNNNAVTNANQTVGTSLGRPSAIVMGRLLRLGGRIAF